MQTIRVVCAHDCPDMCSLLAQVEDGRVVRIQGDPPIRSPPVLPAPRSTATTSWCIRRSACDALRRIGAKGEGRFAPLTLGRGARRDRRALEGDHRAIGTAGAPRLRLQRASGPDEPRARHRPLPCARHQPPAGRHGVRHLLRDGLGHDRRADRRRRPRGRHAVRPDRLVGRRPGGHQRAFLGQGGGGAQDGRAGDRHRSAPQPHRAARRLAHPHPHRHGCRAGARRDAHPGARRPVRRDYLADPHGRLRSGQGRGPAALRARARGRDHRAQPSPTSSASPPSTGGAKAPSSASARA